MGSRNNVMGQLVNENARLRVQIASMQARIEQRHVDAAESLVKKAVGIASVSQFPLNEVLGSILSVASKVQYLEWEQKQREMQDGQQTSET